MKYSKLITIPIIAFVLSGWAFSQDNSTSTTQSIAPGAAVAQIPASVVVDISTTQPIPISAFVEKDTSVTVAVIQPEKDTTVVQKEVLQPEIREKAVQPKFPVSIPAREPSGEELLKSMGEESYLSRKVSMHFDRASIDQVLSFITRITGLTIIKDTDIPGEISIISDKDITVEDAIAVFNSALVVKGYTAIRSGNNLKIILLEAAKTSEIPVRFSNDPKKIKPTDEFITMVFPLTYADAYQIRKDIATLISKRGDMSANARSNTLMITDSAANVRRIAEIVKQLDTPQVSSSQVRVFNLKNGDATLISKIITSIFKQDQTSTSDQSSNVRFGGPGGGPGGIFGGMGRGSSSSNSSDNSMSPSSEDLVQSRLRTAVKVTVDTRINAIIVLAPMTDMEVIAGLINSLDKDETVDEANLVIHLQHGDAGVITNIISKLISSTSNTASSSNNQRGFNPFFGGGNTQSSSQSNSNSTLVGEVRVAADTISNSIVFLAPPRSFERLQKMVESLDVARAQVLIEVLIAERSLTDESQLGVEWSIMTTTGSLFGNALMSTLTTSFNLTNITQGMRYSVTNKNIGAVVSALKQNTKLNILSTPRVLTSDNSEAMIKVGRKVPFLSSRQVTDTGSVYNSYNYQDVGITLTVTPHINPDGFVSMDVHPVISKIENVTYYDAPVIANREATTNVRVKDGETVIIGGLMSNDMTESEDKVPFVGDLPMIGNLFKYKDTNKEKTELMIFLTPRVVKDAETLNTLSVPFKERLNELSKPDKKK